MVSIKRICAREFGHTNQVGTAETKFINGKGLQVNLNIVDIEKVKGLKPAPGVAVKKANNNEVFNWSELTCR